ncbi:hypothetical protein HOI18_00915 [Candidatus Uhrbacteria bacterium]|jgi:hypothetical protein|nr:hypothetical protein [Candidatus Uhrbacteria bacterium]
MTTINDAFSTYLSRLELNKSFQDAVSTHHQAVRSKIAGQLPTAKTILIGSLQRKTRIQPREEDEFDIDILLVMGRFTGWASGSGGITPHDAMTSGKQALSKSRYENMGLKVDHPVIGFKYADSIGVEIVPAYEDHIGQDSLGNNVLPAGRGYWVASKEGVWVHADYDHDAAVITAHNNASDLHLVPMIKLLKSLKRQYFPQMDSFHLEILAATWMPAIISENKKRGIPITYPSLLQDFFGFTKNSLTSPVSFASSNTPEQSLGTASASKSSQTFTEIHRLIASANSRTSQTAQIEFWLELFGKPFPST